MRFKLLDIFIILTAAALTFFTAVNVYLKPSSSLRVLIKGQDEWSFPIGANETVIAAGPLGDTVIRISDNRAWVESSPCENQNCVIHGSISRHGQWAACLPNKVLLTIEGTDDVDTVAW